MKYKARTKKWIPKLKAGALRKQLGIPNDKKIPIGLLNRIIKARRGQRIRNTTGIGKRFIRVTRLLERRAILARNLKRIKKG